VREDAVEGEAVVDAAAEGVEVVALPLGEQSRLSVEQCDGVTCHRLTSAR
jgi:hypothetical protein